MSERVTVRDLFTHTAGWFGEYLPPTGHGSDAAGDPRPMGDFIRDSSGAIAYFRWGLRARRRAG